MDRTTTAFQVKINRGHVSSQATTQNFDDKVRGFVVVALEGRKPAARLDISGTPGVEQLKPMEREGCHKMPPTPPPPHARLRFPAPEREDFLSLGGYQKEVVVTCYLLNL